jgi:hypothetical protein
MTIDPKATYPLKRYADLTGLTPRYVLELARSGRIPGCRKPPHGGQYRVDGATLLQCCGPKSKPRKQRKKRSSLARAVAAV